ncbi:MAG: hypothetical protein JW997_06965 [Actinobacteria bacterium]|nr:hypothetical protein [Actinomycetota bacterium]
MRKNPAKTKYLKMAMAGAVLIISAVIFTVMLSGCSSSFFVSGASYGYFIWEDKNSDIHIAWSADKKDNSFKGSIATDGIISEYELIGFEEDDRFDIGSEKSNIDFDAALSANDFSDEIVISLKGHSYVEFDLKINDGYDLSRINAGGFLVSPDDTVFKLEKDYFEKVKKMPFYERHPVSGFISKLAGDMAFTLFYLFLIGVVIIEIIRITLFRKNRKYNWYLFLCYGILAAAEVVVFILLKNR